MELSHGRDLCRTETASKTASQISRELFDNLLPIAGSFLPRLLVLDDAPSDFPIRRCHQRIDHARRSASRPLQQFSHPG